ncbi:hypothetical protein [Photobacterium leiognathi]|uniref:hypothetical protein n=1 Tax=Photobacterium leiognathi TaxID=553611 RepID=UPI0029813DEF|nr:hypothetical protein [Photobacterium leiognathi]
MDKSILVFGTLFAATMAGIFSLFSLINNKEQKVSEFRQAWIDGLRNEIATIVASLYYISYYYSTRTQQNPAKADDIEESHKEYVKSCTSILTRINAQDPDDALREKNQAFLDSLNNIQNAFNANRYSDAAKLSKNLIDDSKPLLKAEWERVKAGEKSYRRTKWLAGGLSVFGAIVALIFLIANYKLTGSFAVEKLTS